MGIIAEYVQRKLEEEIRSKDLLVWMDKNDEYTSLVDEWRERYRNGNFPYPFFAFRVSFLELPTQQS